MAVRLGVDFGGTKIEAAALDADGRFLARRRAPNPGDYAAAIDALDGLLRQVCEDSGADRRAGVGIGIPGSPNPGTGQVRNANTTWLNGRRLKNDIEAALGVPVRLANDANCFALSEATDGAAAGARSVFGVIVGTGCGGGVVVDGRLAEGANGIAGEWGHTPLPWPEENEGPGPECWCGRRGCLETWLSGPGMAADHARAAAEALGADEIARRAAAGDEACAATLERYRSRLARALAVIADILDPEIVVLGGGVSNIDAIYEGLPERIAGHAFSDAYSVRIARAKHGDSSGVRGAAWLFDDRSGR